MKPTDLRIGNMMQEQKTGRLLIVTTLTKTSVTYQSIDGTEISDFSEPLPITSEWLERFGYEKQKFYDQQYGYYKNYLLSAKDDGFELLDHDFKNTQVIKYVHQLQNLDFALTGKELELKN